MGVYKLLLYDNSDELKIILEENEVVVDYTNNAEDIPSLIRKNRYDSAILNPEICKCDMDKMIKTLLAKKIPSLIILNKYDEVEKVIEALSSGGFDYFLRPSRVSTEKQREEIIGEIISKVYLSSTSKDKIKPNDAIIADETIKFNFRKSTEKIIIIGSSTGGPQSLDHVIPFFPKEIPAPIIVVQHMPPIFTKKLAERLDSLSNVKVKEAEEGEELTDGVCYIAPGDYHLELKRKDDKTIIKLNQKERILGVRPCINVTMESAAKLYGKNTIGIVLTGMGSDGTIGSKKIKEKGGTILVQSEATSIIYGMPKAVVVSGYYDAIVDLQKIPVATLQVLEV